MKLTHYARETVHVEKDWLLAWEMMAARVEQLSETNYQEHGNNFPRSLASCSLKKQMCMARCGMRNSFEYRIGSAHRIHIESLPSYYLVILHFSNMFGPKAQS